VYLGERKTEIQKELAADVGTGRGGEYDNIRKLVAGGGGGGEKTDRGASALRVFSIYKVGRNQNYPAKKEARGQRPRGRGRVKNPNCGARARNDRGD